MADGRTVADIGEDGLVGSVLARYGTPPVDVLVGPGDDAAVLDIRGRVVVSTDTLVEGYDFRRDWSGARDVGRKTAAQNLADIAAMGAVPIALLVSLAAPGTLAADWAGELAEGLAAECARAGAAVVGGDVSAAGEIVITGTALGRLTGPAVLRSGARPGDVVALAGETGPSAAGLALLLSGWDVPTAGRQGRPPGPAGAATRTGTAIGLAAGEAQVVADLLAAHRAPQPPYPAGPAAAVAGATAMIDTSDGLLRDARRLGEASGVVVDLDSARLAPGEHLLTAARLLGRAGEPETALGWVLTGGEDHALLACFGPGAELPAQFRAVGTVRNVDVAAGGQPGVTVDGRVHAGPDGWHHFA
jgi:thiamine-monophosphate kinase